jgi:hypothetical protein
MFSLSEDSKADLLEGSNSIEVDSRRAASAWLDGDLDFADFRPTGEVYFRH